MRLTTQARQAINAMAELALGRPHSFIRLADIADRQRISLSYLEVLFGKLRRRGLVASVRGPGGGYRLAKPAAAICVAEIVEAVDGASVASESAAESRRRRDGQVCPTDALWQGLATMIHDHLRSVSLADLLLIEESEEADVSDTHLPAVGTGEPIPIQFEHLRRHDAAPNH